MPEPGRSRRSSEPDGQPVVAVDVGLACVCGRHPDSNTAISIRNNNSDLTHSFLHLQVYRAILPVKG